MFCIVHDAEWFDEAHDHIDIDDFYVAYDNMEHNFYDDPKPLNFNFAEHHASKLEHRSGTKQNPRSLQTDIFHMPQEFIDKHANLTLSKVLDASGWHINDHSVFNLAFRRKEFVPEESLINEITVPSRMPMQNG